MAPKSFSRISDNVKQVEFELLDGSKQKYRYMGIVFMDTRFVTLKLRSVYYIPEVYFNKQLCTGFHEYRKTTLILGIVCFVTDMLNHIITLENI